MKHLLCSLMLGFALTAAPVMAHDTQAMAEVQAGTLTLSGGFARATLPRAPVGGAYLTIANSGSTDDRLVAVSSGVSPEAQIHEMSHAEGVMTMRHLPDGLPLPAGETVQMTPGGVHLMLMGLTEPLVEGGTLDLMLTFEQAGVVAVSLPILAVSAREPMPMEH